MPTSDEIERSQPQFSPGERLARIEAEIACLQEERGEAQVQLDRRLAQTSELFDERLKGCEQSTRPLFVLRRRRSRRSRMSRTDGSTMLRSRRRSARRS